MAFIPIESEHYEASRALSSCIFVYECSDDAFLFWTCEVKKGLIMLMTIAVVLLVLWALGLLSPYAMGGLIHILLVAAVVIVLVRILQGRRIL